MLTDEESAALAAVDEAGTARTLMELISVPSVTGSPAESELQHQLAGRLEWLGLDVDLWSMDLPALRAEPDFPGTEAPREEAWGLVGTTPDGGDGPTLILQGHVDVVPPGDLAAWDGDPFVPRVAGDLVHGRGACDMKAGLAAHLAALTAIRTAGIRLRGRVAVHFVVGEEDGGLGAFGTLRRGHTGDACVIAEPTAGTLITANAGALTFRLSVPGKAAHGSTRDKGVSAVDAYLPLHRALAALETERNRDPDPLLAEYPVPYGLSVGTLRAGDWASSVPDLLVAEGRFGVRLGEDPADARAALERCVAEACAADPWLRDHPATVTWPGGQFASGMLPEGHPLADTVGAAHADATGGSAPRRRGATYGSDLRHYTGAGIPALQYGPGDIAVAHSERERVSVREVVEAARTLVLTVLRTVGVK
ncbi:ArgE/DapE family deacylase [Streptomyces pseudogriseolus]|uniref:Amidohydrolase n=3 Tax=Streptomyces TaxID=1883 RepID=M3CUU7_STREZ|nr:MULTISPECIES: ArgE/DapE family deacylase [Streptomyces]EMF27858.1 amidohydrolase [Streptomyces gancidicus BKS 13-15]MCI4142050.1 ArgE/DapE family deacylase [Streptomyces sp. MMS20-AI2-20]GGQ34960.1 acetylornithine deacetylase [Streptomyces gancidicus]GGS52926.1 acetylornithine deacetylase [Streptomyces rubiginosus]